MTCTEKERDTCQVEKMGCEGCAYYEEDKEKPNKQKKEDKDEQIKQRRLS